MPEDPADLPPPVLPIAQVSNEYAERLLAGGPGNPLAVAHEWWQAILEGDDDDARMLSVDGDVWDFDEMREVFAANNYGLASGVAPAPDRPDDMVFVKLVRDMNDLPSAVEAMEDMVVPSLILTLIRYPDGTWRVWGAGDYRKASEVFRD